MVGFVVVVLVFLVFVYVRDLVILVGVFVFYGFYIVIEDIVLRVYMVDLVKDYEKGIIIGVYYIVFGFFVFLVLVIVGYLWKMYFLIYSFFFFVVMNLLVFVFMLFVFEC